MKQFGGIEKDHGFVDGGRVIIATTASPYFCFEAATLDEATDLAKEAIDLAARVSPGGFVKPYEREQHGDDGSAI